MTRQTSINAYNKIKAEGLLGKLQAQVYDNLYHSGPLTIAECSQYHLPSIDSRSVSPRFAELEKKGVITTVGKRKCSVTGREVLLWDVTANLPAPVPKKVKGVGPEREQIASRLVWLANPEDFNEDTCDMLKKAAKIIDPNVAFPFGEKTNEPQ